MEKKKRGSKTKYCIVMGCHRTSKNSPNLHFFGVPHKPRRRELWLHILEREGYRDRWFIFVCERHFGPEVILVSDQGIKRLTSDATPTMFLEPSREPPRGAPLAAQPAAAQPAAAQPAAAQPAVTEPAVAPGTSSSFVDVSTVTERTVDHCIPNKRIKLQRNTTVFYIEETPEDDDTPGKCEPSPRPARRTIYKKYGNEFKLFALRLFFNSPAAYRVLHDSLGFPRVSTLYRLCLPSSTELSDVVLKALKLKVDAMNDKEKQSVLCVGSIDVTPSLHYDAKKDYVSGLHEVDGVQTLQPATKVLVVAVRGLFHKWKQPIAIAHLADLKNYMDVKCLIDKVIDRMFQFGLQVRACISDLQTDLVTCASLRGCDPKAPYFFQDNKKIYYLYDPTYLLRSLRETFAAHDFLLTSGSVAKWFHLQTCFKLDSKKKIKLAPKLTAECFELENNTLKYSSEFFSPAVITALATYKEMKLLPASASSTAHFLSMINQLMSIIDFSTIDSPENNDAVFTGDKLQYRFLTNTMRKFEKLQLTYAETEPIETDTIEVLRGFRMTIHSILLLHEDLRFENRWAPPVGLTRDCLNNYFNKVRERYGAPLTTDRVRASITKFPIFNIFQYFSPRSSDDLETFLWHARHMPDIEKYENHCGRSFTDLSEFAAVVMPGENRIEHLALYLLYRAYMHHSHCYIMQLYSCSSDVTEDDDDNQLTGGYLTGDGNVINMVPREFTEFVDILELKFKEYFNESRPTHSISGLLSYVNDVTFEVPCTCFPIDYVKQMFMRYRMFLLLEQNNKLLEDKAKLSDKECRDKTMLTASNLTV
ncbi:uncharacterized protein LOC142979174 [Anticarsia gemmatalis]|uniref:uncharacterized protein LOC142979174 n=1 Tax=Anticarsia gemmatalis TaxID=129554 RepID=UPI003F75985B